MKSAFKARVDDFLAQKTIAVAGYSVDGKQFSNMIADKFRKNGYKVYGVNPKFRDQPQDGCYPDIKSLPEKPDGVMICTPASATPAVVQECIEQKVPRIWMHQSFGEGSHHAASVKLAEENGISVIPTACPMMYLRADFGHRIMKWIIGMSGRLR